MQDLVRRVEELDPLLPTKALQGQRDERFRPPVRLRTDSRPTKSSPGQDRSHPRKKRRKNREEQTVNLFDGLELSHNQGQLRNTGSPFLQDGPQVRPPHYPNPCLFLGNRTGDSRQASDILGNRRTGRNLTIGGSGSSFAGCLRRSSEDGLRRRHVGQGPLCFARHCSAGRGEAREEEERNKARRCGEGVEPGWSFIGFSCSTYPLTLRLPR